MRNVVGAFVDELMAIGSVVNNKDVQRKGDSFNYVCVFNRADTHLNRFQLLNAWPPLPT